jgi:hypothetical protein
MSRTSLHINAIEDNPSRRRFAEAARLLENSEQGLEV